MEDPFATAPAADEAQADPSTEESPFNAPPEEAPKKAPATKKPAKAGTVTVGVKPVMEGFDSSKIVLTLKGGVGFDAPWIVVHATDLQDANDQVSGENALLLVDTMTKLQAAAKKFVELGGGSPAPRGGGGGQQRQSNAPQAAQEAPGGESRHCAHGAMRFKSGIGKNSGKPYSAFFCTSRDRNDECPAQFLR